MSPNVGILQEIDDQHLEDFSAAGAWDWVTSLTCVGASMLVGNKAERPGSGIE
ncbi:hypothetical protein [Streptomyces sp. NPDC048442]|uniref:hypothetical protein n=1 Tax=Streptomyces sp. NPDC048442 TaxID=3154823 RepID=UPI0034449443